jgi:hypothetical protein
LYNAAAGSARLASNRVNAERRMKARAGWGADAFMTTSAHIRRQYFSAAAAVVAGRGAAAEDA